MEEKKTRTDTRVTWVRKLLDKAEANGVTPEEAKMLADKAAELMSAYGIDQAMIADAGKPADDLADKMVYIPDPLGRERRTVLSNIAEAYGLSVLWYPSRRIRSEGNPAGTVAAAPVRLFGWQSDIIRTEALWDVIQLQLASELNAARRPSGVSPGPFRRSFVIAYAETLRGRLEAAEKHAVQSHENSGRAEVAVRDRRQTAADFFTARKGKTRQSAGHRPGSFSGMTAGASAAMKADIGLNRVGRSARAIER